MDYSPVTTHAQLKSRVVDEPHAQPVASPNGRSAVPDPDDRYDGPMAAVMLFSAGES